MSETRQPICGQCGAELNDLEQWSCPHCDVDLHLVGLIPHRIYRQRIRESFRVVADRLRRKRHTEPECGRCSYAVRGMPGFECPECGADVRVVGAYIPKCSLFTGVFLLVAILALWSFITVGGLEYILHSVRTYAPVDYSITAGLDCSMSTQGWSGEPTDEPRILLKTDTTLKRRVWDRKPPALTDILFVLEPELDEDVERSKVYLRYSLTNDDLSWSNSIGMENATSIDPDGIQEDLVRRWLKQLVDSSSDHQLSIVAHGIPHGIKHAVERIRAGQSEKRLLGGGGGGGGKSSSRNSNFSIESDVNYHWDGAIPDSWNLAVKSAVVVVWLIGIAIILRIVFRRPKFG